MVCGLSALRQKLSTPAPVAWSNLSRGAAWAIDSVKVLATTTSARANSRGGGALLGRIGERKEAAGRIQVAAQKALALRGLPAPEDDVERRIRSTGHRNSPLVRELGVGVELLSIPGPEDDLER